MIRDNDTDFELYADDSQLYAAFSPKIESDEENAVTKTENCITEVRSWMSENKLKLNDDKTEFIIFGTKAQLKKINTSDIVVGDARIKSCECVRDLGAMFDSAMSMKRHVSSVCKSCYFLLWKTKQIRKYLSTDATKTLIHALISSRLDYCNCLLAGIHDTLLTDLQHVQNSAARLITGTGKYDHISPVLKELHWLPVKSRIDFKILLLAYKAIHGTGPKYLRDLLQLYVPGRRLRSSDKELKMKEPRTKTKMGDRAFSSYAPTLWNSLPDNIRCAKTIDIFKSLLKTYLFRIAFRKRGLDVF